MPDVRDLYSADDLSRQARLRVARRFGGDAERIRDAMEEYEGTFSSVPDYVRAELEEHVAPCMLWLLDFVQLDRVGDDWIRKGRNWVIADSLKKDSRAVVHVFLSDNPEAVLAEHETAEHD